MNCQVANADHARFSSNTIIADIDVIVASGKKGSGTRSQGRVIAAAGVALECVPTNGGV
jgi:hypothetical protein